MAYPGQTLLRQVAFCVVPSLVPSLPVDISVRSIPTMAPSHVSSKVLSIVCQTSSDLSAVDAECGYMHMTYHSHQSPCGIARLCPDTQPVFSSANVKLDIFVFAPFSGSVLFGYGIIGAEDFERLGIARSPVCKDRVSFTTKFGIL